MNEYERFGRDIAFALHVVPMEEARARTGLVKAASTNDDHKKLVCKLASVIYKNAGKEGCIEYHMFDQLGKQASWNPVFGKLFKGKN